MKIFFVLLHVLSLIFFCKYGYHYFSDDIPIYIFSVLISATFLFLMRDKLNFREIFVYFMLFQSLTIWLCHFFLPVQNQNITIRLGILKTSMLFFALALEVFALSYFIIGYVKTKRSTNFSASEVFDFQLSKFPLAPELRKLFLVEFNIWRTLFFCLPIIRDSEAHNHNAIGKIESGYKYFHFGIAISVALLSCAVGYFFLDGYWIFLPMLIFAYVILLFNCDFYSFSNYSIQDDGKTVKIPTGIYGFLSLQKTNIASIIYCNDKKSCNISVYRIKKPNLTMVLSTPVTWQGKTTSEINICAKNASSLIAHFNEPPVNA